MSFGVEEKKVKLPYVETANIKFAPDSEYPRWKYHVKYPQGIIVNSVEEADGLGEGWEDSLLAIGVETCPSVDKADPVAVRLAEIRAAIAAAAE